MKVRKIGDNVWIQRRDSTNPIFNTIETEDIVVYVGAIPDRLINHQPAYSVGMRVNSCKKGSEVPLSSITPVFAMRYGFNVAGPIRVVFDLKGAQRVAAAIANSEVDI